MSTDTEIHANPAFRRLLRARRVHQILFYVTLVAVLAVLVPFMVDQQHWREFVAFGIAVINSCGQLYWFRAQRMALDDISADPEVRRRATLLGQPLGGDPLPAAPALMPLTFPSHAAAVLPLKLWRPVRLDGVALVIGSTTPDLPYALSPWITSTRTLGGPCCGSACR